ncbi:hypothetical protein [Salininema proteolyticum]|uniref:Gram-positive cocci surface proteins LPxTG domain-containing protein n=1 Tax=Salininema proteolyticum TaxID=1607685 RepID=A0ABV8U3T1_9ACTN
METISALGLGPATDASRLGQWPRGDVNPLVPWDSALEWAHGLVSAGRGTPLGASAVAESAAAPVLPATGAPLLSAFVFAFVLLLTGGFAVLVARSRRR